MTGRDRLTDLEEGSQGMLARKALAAAIVAVMVGGCATAEPSTKDTPDSASTGNSTASPAPAKKTVAKPAAKPHKAGIGDSITLKGTQGETVKVKVLRVLDPAPAGGFDTPSSGKRYVGVEIQLTNTGGKTYKDSPSNGATMIYGADRQADATLLTGGPCSSDGFASDARIAPGSKRRGCIPFEIGKSAKAKTFQFALDSGFSDQGGEWQLR